jgi:hypothetical protein
MPGEPAPLTPDRTALTNDPRPLPPDPTLLTLEQRHQVQFVLEVVDLLAERHGFDPALLVHPRTGTPLGPVLARMRHALNGGAAQPNGEGIHATHPNADGLHADAHSAHAPADQPQPNGNAPANRAQAQADAARRDNATARP